MSSIYRGIVPFVILQLTTLILCMAFPSIATWWPKEVVDPEVAPIIAKLFEWYATGQYSMQEVSRMARDAGLVYRKSGAKVPVSTCSTTVGGWFR